MSGTGSEILFEAGLNNRILSALLSSGQKATVCGAIRRQAAVIRGDVNIVISGPMDSAVKAISGSFDSSEEFMVIGTGPKASTFIVNDIQFNLHVCDSEEYWGAMLLQLTGSVLFNIRLRGIAKKQGYKLNQYGLFHGTEIIAGRTEEQIFDALGLLFIPPVDRSIKGHDKLEFKEIR